MAIKNILVHVDRTDSMDKTIDAANSLAAQLDAHLTGLILAIRTTIPSYAGATIPQEILDELWAQQMAQAKETKAHFLKRVEAIGRSAECRVESCYGNAVTSILGLHARYADLLVLGQQDPAGTAATPNLVEHVVLESGRPLLVIPYIGTRANLGKHVAVAWDASREAARAVSDAMPLMEKAERVTVVAINPEKSAAVHGDEPGADIALHLSRHGINCDVQRSSYSDLAVGDALLSRLADLDCDLLVMGAYGHNRWRQLILGGTTETIVKQMTIPVFLSH